jgi:hypothetical protein
MALVDKKLTDYTELTNPTDDALIHVVEPSDISQSPDGSSYKVKKSVFTKIPAPYTSFKFIQKGFGNTDLINNEIGDIFCGWKNDGTIRYTECIWLGGSLSNSDNFTPLVQTEI